jgi:hypothetical protein
LDTDDATSVDSLKTETNTSGGNKKPAGDGTEGKTVPAGEAPGDGGLAS